MLGMSAADFMLLSEPYSSRDLKNAGKAIVKQREPGNDKLLQLFGDLGAYTTLRNLIAHSRWTWGEAQGGIKPRRVDIRDDKLKLYGSAPNEQEWSEADLDEIVGKLGALNDRIVAYLVERDPSLKTLPQASP